MRADAIKVRTLGNAVELSARVRWAGGGDPFDLWYRFPLEYARHLRPSGNPLLAALMMPAMMRGEPLEIDAPVSRQLLRRSRELQEVYRSWWPELRIVEVRAARECRPWRVPRSKPSACFFSLGVDSFYTLLKNLDGTEHGAAPIAALLFVAGFDVRLDDDGLLGAIAPNLQRVAESTSTTVLFAETNLRGLTDPVVSWEWFHGSALASVGLALERTFGAIYIASSYSHAYLPPWGTHPLTDHLWSSPRVRFIHDGCEASRPEKIAAIAEVPVVRSTLRTCWENRNDRYNCGSCEKCLRTMATLEGLGVLGQMETFPDTFPLDALRGLDWTDHNITRRFGLVLEHMPADSSAHALRELIETELQAAETKPHAR